MRCGYSSRSAGRRLSALRYFLLDRGQGESARDAATSIAEPDTVATAIRIGNPASWASAVAARDDSGGRIDAVPDDSILAAYRDLAMLEGVFCEPSSAATVAGVAALARSGDLDPDALVVCVLTGAGLKDPEIAQRLAGERVIDAPATPDGVRRALGW